MRHEWPAAVHASEIPYVFNTLPARYGKQLTKQDRQMASLMHQYWINFARNGDPNGKKLPEWQSYQADKDNLMMFPISGATASQQLRDPWGPRLDLVSGLISMDK
ncbi:Phenmedipham hydrolase [compost metagenome]